MRTSDKGIVALLSHEGIVPGPYLDSVGVQTYGVGHTAAAGHPIPKQMPAGMPSDLDAELVRVFEVFRKDLEKYEADVRRAIKVDVTQAQFDAAVSFHYNTGAIGRASWVKALNSGDVKNAGLKIMSWKKPAEIIPRRKDEQKLFQTGEYPHAKIIVWGVTKDRRVIWKPQRTLRPTEAIQMLQGARVTSLAPSAPKQRGKAGPLAAVFAAIVALIASFACKIPFLNTLISACGG